jgi:acyl-CoA dehydrogenase
LNFDLTSNQEEYKRKVMAVSKKLQAANLYEEENLEHYQFVLDHMVNGSLFDPLLAEDEGSIGKSFAVITAREYFSRYYPFADFIFAEQALAITPLLLFGNAKQKKEHLPALIHGNKIGGFALTEETSGSDASSLSCQAVKTDDGHYVLTGKKVWISNAPIGDLFIVFARTSEDKKKGVSAFIIDAANEKGIKRNTVELAAPHPIGELIFDNVKIDRSRLLGEEGEGFKMAMASLDILRPGVGAHAIGTSKSALDFIIPFTQERISFGQPLSSYQSIQFKIADMYTKIRTAQWLVYHCAWKRDTGGNSTLESSMAKMYATEIANEVLYQCTQIHGARGVVKDSHLEKLSRIIRPAAIYEGTTEVQKMVIHRQLTKMFDENGEIL